MTTAWVWANEAASFGDAADVLAAVEAADFVIVQGAVRGDLAELADVVLPSVAWGEEDGTFTNAERRISRLRRVQRPAGAARPGWWAFREVAKRLGHEWQAGYPKAVWEDEIALLIPSLAGVTWAEIEEYGLCWPAPGRPRPGLSGSHSDAGRRTDPSGPSAAPLSRSDRASGHKSAASGINLVEAGVAGGDVWSVGRPGVTRIC